MGYYAGTINYTLAEHARFTRVAAFSTAACVQCYVAGELVDSQIPAGTGVEFNISPPGDYEYIRLLAVDADSAEVDYFADAFPNDAGNKIRVRTPTLCGDYARGELWRVYLDDTLIKEQPVWPLWKKPESATSRIGGRGRCRGIYRGFETYGSGRGNWRGLQRGYEPVTLLHETDAQIPGTLNIKSCIVDAAENESTATEENITLDTYPQPPSDLTIESYDQGSDTLVLNFTASDDV